jgi:hypothetical protein
MPNQARDGCSFPKTGIVITAAFIALLLLTAQVLA